MLSLTFVYVGDHLSEVVVKMPKLGFVIQVSKGIVDVVRIFLGKGRHGMPRI